MHAVRVGVGVGGMDVLVAVGVDVLGTGVYVGKIVAVRVTVAVSLARNAVGSWMIMLVGISIGCVKVTSPQACTSINTIKRTASLLHTLAVYHKKSPADLY
jgi:hypothetical protein